MSPAKKSKLIPFKENPKAEGKHQAPEPMDYLMHRLAEQETLIQQLQRDVAKLKAAQSTSYHDPELVGHHFENQQEKK